MNVNVCAVDGGLLSTQTEGYWLALQKFDQSPRHD